MHSRRSPALGGTNDEPWWTSQRYGALSSITGGASKRPLRVFLICVADDLGILPLASASWEQSAVEWVGKWFYRGSCGTDRMFCHRHRDAVSAVPFERFGETQHDLVSAMSAAQPDIVVVFACMYGPGPPRENVHNYWIIIMFALHVSRRA